MLSFGVFIANFLILYFKRKLYKIRNHARQRVFSRSLTEFYNYKIVFRFKMKEHGSWYQRGFWDWIDIHYYYDYIIKRQQHAEAIFDDSMTTMFEKVKKKYAICIICVSLTDFREPASSVLSICSIILNPTTIL
jgi:hypothetical protein